MTRHGQNREQLSEVARVDDSYCKHTCFWHGTWLTSHPVSVMYYAEGTLMPILAFKLTFDVIPEGAPILLKPFLKTIFDALNNRLNLPKLRVQADFVSAEFPLEFVTLIVRYDR